MAGVTARGGLRRYGQHMAGLGDINRVPKRAEARATEQLRGMFVDSGVATALGSIDHHVLYGLRDTGKTHARRYLETVVVSRGDLAVYVALTTTGSPDRFFAREAIPASERTARLLVDLLGQLDDSLLEAAIADDLLIGDQSLVARLDIRVAAITTARKRGDVESSDEVSAKIHQSDDFTSPASGSNAVIASSTRVSGRAMRGSTPSNSTRPPPSRRGPICRGALRRRIASSVIDQIGYRGLKCRYRLVSAP
jgi:hypothetical protein